MAIKNLFRDALAADQAFEKALRRAYGKKASNARYDERSKSTPELKRLSEAKRAADLALHNAFCARRGEQAPATEGR